MTYRFCSHRETLAEAALEGKNIVIKDIFNSSTLFLLDRRGHTVCPLKSDGAIIGDWKRVVEEMSGSRREGEPNKRLKDFPNCSIRCNFHNRPFHHPFHKSSFTSFLFFR